MALIYSAHPIAGELIDVEMGEVRVSTRLTDTLLGYGLGACVGVCVYDPALKVAGMAHVVLPERQNYQNGAAKPQTNSSLGKFAETAIPHLIDEVCRSGGQAKNLCAAVVGGAHIFSHGGANGGPVSRLEIGQRNAAAVAQLLIRFSIPIIGSDVGGCHGRTVTLRVSDGMVTVRPIGASEEVLAVLGREREAAGCTR